MNRRPASRRWVKDGVGDRRTPITVLYRPTEEELARVEKVAKAYGLSVEQLLTRALKEGVERALQDAREHGVPVDE